MVRFLGSGRPCAVLAILMILAAGCGTGRAHATPAGQPRSQRPRPAPSATGTVKHGDFLTGVTCQPAGTCVAVGWYYYGATGPSLTQAIRWNGRAGLAMPTPGRGQHSRLDGVSCATAANCLAVGTYNAGVFGIPEHWDGSRWTIRRLPIPPGAPGEDPLVLPASVSCSSATACVTVGSNQAANMAERWNGTTWTVQRTPDPA